MIKPTPLRAAFSVVLNGFAALVFSTCAVQAAPPATPTFTHLFQTVPTTATNSAYGAGITATHFTLYWTDNATDENFFHTEIKVGSLSNPQWLTLAYPDPNANFAYYTPDLLAIFPALTQGTSISFRVSACKGTRSADKSTAVVLERSGYVERTVSFDSIADLTFPAPTGFTVAAAPGADNRLVFSWGDTADKEEEWVIFFKDSPTASYPSSPAVTFSFGNKTQELTAGLVPGTTYYWQMKGRRATAYGVVSGQFQATGWEYGLPSSDFVFTMPALIPPSGLIVTAKDEKTVTLTWSDNSQNRTHYALEYRNTPGSGSFETWSYVPAAAGVPKTTTDLAWFPNLNTEWRVSAIFDSNPIKSSTPSNAVTLKLPFGAPTNLQATISGVEDGIDGTVSLTWADNSSIETGFYVLRRPTVPANGTFALIKTISTPDTTSTTVPATQDAGVSYDYQIIAFYTSGTSTFESDPSNTAVAVTKDRLTNSFTPVINPNNLAASFPLTLTSTTASARTGFTATGLPAGLTLDTTTGVISGVPTSYGLFNVAITATFANGFTDRKTLVLRIPRPPAGPTTPLIVTARSIGLTTVTMPLTTVSADTSMFADADSEAAVRVTTSAGSFDMILHKTATPETYANFMAYVNAGDYNGSCFHRVSPGFVLQGGGYKPLTADGADKYEEITQRPSPLNEPGISNVVGTVAMARSSGVNSATHDFFVNLGSNNPSMLDNSNGGFTAFGRIAGNGLTSTIDAINSKPGRNDYTISLRPSGSTSFTDFQPIIDPGLGSGTKWPLDDSVEPASMDNTKAMTMTIAPVPVLSFSADTPTNPTKLSAGISGSNLVLTGLEDGDSDVTVTATDLDGNTISQTFTVHVITGYAAPSISTQPVAQTVTKDNDATFSVVATGTGLTYQWKKNGQNIPTANQPSYTITNAQTTDAGDYTVLITNDAGFVLSEVAHLTVRVPVSISAPLLPQTLNYNAALSFTVAATGDPTITYQWRKGTSDINGATNPTFSIAHVLMTDDADYSVVVANGVNSVTSNIVHVTVNPIDTDSDGLFDHEELALIPPSAINDTDSDDDGFGDALEYAEGTSLTSASSKPSTTTKFLAMRDGDAVLASIAFKRLLGATVPSRTTDVAVPDVWMATYELSNKEFASILQQARQRDLISISTESGRRVVRYPKTSGEIVCYLATPAAPTPADPPSCDVDVDSVISTSFSVPVAKEKNAACAITWHGAYLCTVVLNEVRGYAGKNVPATWSFNAAADGFHLPGYSAWELAGRGISPTFAKPGLVYPTGAAVSATLAYFAQPIAITGPKDVGKYAASRLGLFDLAGNVEEWVFEGADATHAFTRGGSFADPSTELINTADESLLLTAVSRQVGVRLALKAPAQATITTPPAAKFQSTALPLSLSVAATGVPPLTYQWYKNNVALTGKTAATLTIDVPTLANAGNYTVKVFTQGVNPVTSASAPVALVEAKNPPPLTTIAAGKGTSFQAKAAGAPGQTFSYQWKTTAGNILADGNFATPTSSKLVLSTMLPTHSRVYTCDVSLNGQSALPAVGTDFELLVLQRPEVLAVSFGNLVVSGSVDVPIVINTGATYKPSSFLITGLPSGLTYNTTTGRITGKPLVNGVFTVTIKAINAYGTSLPLQAVIYVNLLDVRATGSFVGLVDRHPSATLNNNLGGRLDLTISTNGKYTGSLNLAGTKYPLNGGALDAADPTLSDHDPSGIYNITRPGKPTLSLSFKIDLETNRFITTTVSELPTMVGGPTPTANVTGWRKIWNSTVNAGGWDHARINMSLTPPAGDVDVSPRGVGHGTLTVDRATGSCVVAGKLPDNNALACSAFLSPPDANNHCDVLHFQTLYANTSSVHGLMKEVQHTRTVSAATAWSWSKKPQAASSTDRIYKDGFDTTLAVVGAPYTAPATNVIIGGLLPTTSVPLYPRNARLTFTDAFFPPTSISSLIKDFIISTANVVSPMPYDILENPQSVTCVINKTTGLITGTFKLSDNDPSSNLAVPPKVTRTVSWSALVIPSSPTQSTAGYFILYKLPNKTPDPHTINNSEGLSGKVTFGRVP